MVIASSPRLVLLPIAFLSPRLRHRIQARSLKQLAVQVSIAFVGCHSGAFQYALEFLKGSIMAAIVVQELDCRSDHRLSRSRTPRTFLRSRLRVLQGAA